MDFDEYTKSYLYKYAENPFTTQEFEAISKKDLVIIKYVNDKINKISTIIEKIELIKIHIQISTEQILQYLVFLNLKSSKTK